MQRTSGFVKTIFFFLFWNTFLLILWQQTYKKLYLRKIKNSTLTICNIKIFALSNKLKTLSLFVSYMALYLQIPSFLSSFNIERAFWKVMSTVKISWNLDRWQLKLASMKLPPKMQHEHSIKFHIDTLYFTLIDYET